MSMDLSEFYEVFFEECVEGLQIMESGLLNLDTGDADVEEINTIFRAAHSIKGGSATFDFIEITQFTHVMETLLDQMRAGERQVSAPVVDLLLQSVDCLSEMIEATKAEEPIQKDRVQGLQKRLEAALGDKNFGNDGAEEKLTPDSGLEQTTNEEIAEADASIADSDRNVIGWKVGFTPAADALKEGHDPISIFESLSELGELTVSCDTSNLPALDELDPTLLHLVWEANLFGSIERKALDDVLSWVEGQGEFKVEPILGAPKNDTSSADATSPESGIPASQVSEVPVEKSGEAKAEPAKKTVAAPAATTQKPDKTASAAPAKKKAPQTEGSIRVGISKIDALINLVGELVITQSMLGRFGEEFDMSDIDALRDGLSELERNSRELQTTAMQIRMLPISTSFNRFPRLVRDLSHKLGKKVELKINGENTELDKTVLEKIGDPLVHLVRNSLDHGLETPDIRTANGKSEVGYLTLNAFHEGGNIVIEVIDDGAGLNGEKILSKAIERGLVSPEDNLEDDEIYNLIFQPGFSTADVVSDVSGRGVGMDVVRRNINDLGGQVYIYSEPGKGSTLKITLPLTLAIIDGQLVRVGNEHYVVPMLSIDESLQLNPVNIKPYKGKSDLYKLRDEYIPILRLRDAFNSPGGPTDLNDGLLVVVEAERRRVGLFVDELLGQQQVVIKSIEKNFRKVEGFSGATILGDGKVALIIDAPGLIRKYLLNAGKAGLTAQRAAA